MKSKMRTFDKGELTSLCDEIALKDADLHSIILKYGYPPFWDRKPNFETLIHIILEQQVSLASAKSALLKLKGKLGTITAEKLILLSDQELRDCYFSRQKTSYAKNLAREILTGRLVPSRLSSLSDLQIREKLTAVKGIGNWTVDIFLLMALHRIDVFPAGDLAAVRSLKRNKNLPQDVSRETVLKISETWKPYRSIATMILWHSYIRDKNIKL
ncbi:DNA-3-methyladenine glycosylase [Leptospira ellisii]|uniref:DNA-3-methyladenine glycosylase II n=1 Tax=Leptospira ellisii TaxID=2023197 RepID=A0A2N0BKG7_9LEPT|nr:DNA-3-methyladenine glycosylase [Leptospira ellisii]MDV6237553.1 DNA-3-methyladenine glycosylase [Leptospira ellisii]PJZ92625.1 3-methyladenine DNA glycosylase [Leptospira ellisii]PKA04501.1 3-methyladenine DNA glycosylase [Leptospira ellisii]